MLINSARLRHNFENNRNVNMFNLINGTKGNVKNDVLSGIHCCLCFGSPKRWLFAFVGWC